MKKQNMMPDYLFEVSWEVCNKVGGIHTVLATKALYLSKELKKNHIHIGPDVWMHTSANPEFTEDLNLFRSWRNKAATEGLRVRVGRWNVPGNPVAILVDFTPYIANKDSILGNLWEKFGVDSLNGNWDYIESALFGYSAGKVIESFMKFNIRSNQKVVAQFHEWMTGAGLLYLKDRQIPAGTIFTTHATVMGRCIAGHNLPLYEKLRTFNADELAREYGVSSRHSLEKVTAKNADVFTTVSEITSEECGQFLGRKADVVTPNGFESSITPSDEKYPEARAAARARLLKVASAMSGKKYDDDTVLICTSGRYEYTNKGIDIFIDAMAKLNESGSPARKVAAFIMVPSGNNGPDKALVEKLAAVESNYVTNISHYLMDDFDVVRRRLKEVGLNNGEKDKVDVFFVPSYLKGNDGVFDMKYYDLLVGMDLSIFPSYYEPWGYTPLEALAYSVPTVTTTLAGFGLWVKDHYHGGTKAGISVVTRTDSNYDSVVSAVSDRIAEIANLDEEGKSSCRKSAKTISEIALWDNNINYYKEAYSKAISKIINVMGAYPAMPEDNAHFQKIQSNYPSWNNVLINRNLPERLAKLDELSKNLWWCWNQEAIDLFESIDPALWKATKCNPLALLDKISLKSYKELEKSEEFLARLDAVYAQFTEYMAAKTNRPDPKIAYFCMEYGLDSSLKIYSGGLGILAGDYLKEASDMNVNMTAVGLLYRFGYFTQYLSAQGEQVSTYEPQDFLKIPADPIRDENGKWKTVSIAFPGRNLYARLWKVAVGRTDLILLDTDFEDNRPEDRAVTHQLYGGDWENRLKQELLLGVGGVRALRKLGIDAQIYHCNEGHAAFMGLERLREYIENQNLSFSEALEVVRSSSLFTTHTPVPAGHDAFTEDILRIYIAHYPGRMKIDWHTLMGLGKINAYNQGEKFSMSYLAANLSQEVNGVSWLHGKVSQKIFACMWPGYLPDELHVSYVTNGVHYPTWAAPEWKQIHSRVFGEQFKTHHYDLKCFEGIYQIPDEEVWATRTALRKKLIAAVKNVISDTTATAHYSPYDVDMIKRNLRDDVLTIGFARRFATYKRATLLFRNLERLDQIVNNPERPVQFLFAGKAHPADRAGQDLIRRIVEISKMPQFIGKIVFVPNYDISIAKLLVQGVDVWMNNPTRPQEASGTSGEKAAMNGVMHFSVLDGWWVEGYKPGAGWALPQERTFDDQRFQDELDAVTIYSIIERDIAKTYYDVDKQKGYSPEWVKTIKNCVAQVACNFTMNRQLSDYLDRFYVPMAERNSAIVADDFMLARDIAFWKKRLYREWPAIEVRSFIKPDNSTTSLELGKEFVSEANIFLGELDPSEIGIELVQAEQDKKGEYHIKAIFEYEVVNYEDGVATYRTIITPEVAGTYQLAARMYARNASLAHRQDFDLVKWL